MPAAMPRTVGIPYAHGSLELSLREGDRVIEGQIATVRPEAPGAELVRRALESPIGTPRLSELSRTARSVVIVTSDHTRAIPSSVTLPLLLEEVRRGNPEAEITILVATGLHRATTREEQRAMFGSRVVDSERIVIHDAFDESAHVDLGTLPSGACFFVDRLVTTCDLLVTEGFIEPHFFAGFSGGRKSILPGVCSERTVKENHSYRAIASDRARSAVLDGNPIHLDMVEAARRVNVAFILNVALNGSKEIIGAWAGDVERAHEEGTRFVAGLTQRPVETADIVITGNGGHPLDQNLYQSPKAASTAAEYAGEDGVIILCCSCSDTTSGMASNCVIGRVADHLVDLGATVVFGETTEFIGGEDLLAARAVSPEVARRIYEIVDAMETRAKSVGCDMRRGQPTPGNIAGGLSSIEEKSLGAIVKSGTRPIQGVLDYPETAFGRKGLWIKDTPGREPEILTGMAATGAQFMCFSTGRGAPQGFPSMPVVKICGNPHTYQRMRGDMDVDAGRIIEGAASIDQVADEAFGLILRVLSGELTKNEAIGYTSSIDIHCLGPVI